MPTPPKHSITNNNPNFLWGFGSKERIGGVYEYSFQAQEQDGEIKGPGNSINYKYRMHDTRLGRFFAVDPLAAKYPWNSPYAFSENRVIDGVELEGAEYYSVHIQRSPDGSKPFSKSLIKIVSHRDTEKGYGPKGPGIEYVYHGTDVKGRKYTISVMVKNLHGIYQGGNNPKKYWENKDPETGEYPDDYQFDPIDETDAAAKQHDLDYDKVRARGLGGVLDESTEDADNAYINRANKIIDKYNNGGIDNVTGKPVTEETKKAAEFGRRGFKIAKFFKTGPKSQQRKLNRQIEKSQSTSGPKL
jgi:hypothetical protein